jgi:hypothetical protein
MAQGGTIAQRITDLIGSQYSTDSAYAGDLINAAINEIADMVSEDLLIKYSKTPGVLESNSEWLVEGRKILKVTRIDADSSGIERECKAVDRDLFASSGDSGSINYATVYSPIYHLDSANAGAATLKILPEPTTPQKGKIWYFSYVTSSSPDGDITDVTEATLNTALYLPNNLIHAIALKSSANILQAYISNQIQDEEDNEMLAMVVQQMQGLEASFQKEISRFMDDSGKPGGE